jgi:hypothetical protein
MTDVVYVTNGDEQDFAAEFCAVEYTFKKGQTTELPAAAARHIFGYGDDNKLPYLTRLGWVRLNTDFDKGLERLAKITFSAEPPSKGRSLPSAVGVVPLPVEKRAEGKPNARAA